MRKVIFISCFCISVFGFAESALCEQWGQLIYKENSLYHTIFVYKQGSIVTLRFGKQPAVQVQSQVDENNLREHQLEYTKMAFCGLFYKPEPKKILVLGLGGGVIPRELHHYFPAARVDVAEIDPAIGKVAKAFFGFNEDNNLKVHIADGRMFIKEQIRDRIKEKYDIIILDAFNSDYIPFHLMTKEFLEEANDVLADDGVVVANVFYNNRLYDAELATFLTVFGRCQIYFASTSTNAMLVSTGPKGQMLNYSEAMARAYGLQQKIRPSFDMTMIVKQLKPVAMRDPRAKPLTDDKAPVNWLREQKKTPDSNN